MQNIMDTFNTPSLTELSTVAKLDFVRESIENSVRLGKKEQSFQNLYPNMARWHARLKSLVEQYLSQSRVEGVNPQVFGMVY